MELIDTFESLRRKDVINLCDGTRFGHATNLEIQLQTGRICKLIIPVSCGCISFIPPRREYRIPWDCIRKSATTPSWWR